MTRQVHLHGCTTIFAKDHMYDYTTNHEVPQDNVYHYRRPEDIGFVKYLSETNV